jgi:hypothetical protein
VRRRDFLAAIAAGVLVPGALGARPRRRRPAEWSFRLDDEQRWSLVSRAGAPAVARAEIVVLLEGGDPTPLGGLEEVRRFRLAPPNGGGAGWQVIGGLAGVEVTAVLLDGPPPRITVTARGLGSEQALGEIRFLDQRTARLAALDTAGRGAAPRLLVNGYQSDSDCRVITLDGSEDATGHWQAAVLPARSGRAPAGGLALSFGSDDGGEGRFDVAGGLAAVSAFGRRPVSMSLAPASASLAIVPGVDPLAELGRLASIESGAPAPPSGWSSGHALGAAATEDDLLAALEAASTRFDAAAFRLVRLDDGYQRSAGDWETGDRFPHGHRWLTDRIHAAGLKAGVWLAPFAVAERSGIPTAHPEWLLHAADGEPLVVAQRPEWGGTVYGLDAAQVPVRDYLRELARHAVTAWGYDHLELGALHIGAAGSRPGRRVGSAEAYRAGLRALREGAQRAFVAASGAPLQHAAGLVDAMRATRDVDRSFVSLAGAARGSLLRAHLHGAAWINDADAVLVGEPLTLEEARAWASVVALSGDMALASEPLEALPAERLAILRRVMPAAPVRGRPLGLASADWRDGGAPAWVLAQVQDDWWVLAAVNWDDAPQRMTVDLADHGLAGRLAAYDVWLDARRDDVDGRLTLAMPPHAATVLSLRRPRRTPYVLGSTRHVVQGLLDIEDERWDGRRRVLSARSLPLAGLPYAVTVALPRGFEAGDVRADPDTDVAVEAAAGGSVRLVIPQAPGEAVEWEIAF